MNTVVEVFIYSGRYHGSGEAWPSPGRLYQALVAAAGARSPEESEALRWLEAQPPPELLQPTMVAGDEITLWVPDNDLDAVGNDPRRISEIRSAKTQRPMLFDAGQPFVFRWQAGPAHVATLEDLCRRVYQFGRGIDQAWARLRVLSSDEWTAYVGAHKGQLLAPGEGEGGELLRVPTPGTLSSLEARFLAGQRRFQPLEKKQLAYVQPPKARFAAVTYGAARQHLLFDLRDAKGEFWPWPLARTAELVELVRNRAEARLGTAAAKRALRGIDDNDAQLVGVERVRITALPSIGMAHTDPSVRRVLVEIPSSTTISVADWRWAFTSDEPVPGTAAQLTTTSDFDMVAHYREASRVWRSITPVALPESSARRRIEPARQWEERKPAGERDDEERRAVGAVFDALRHAGELRRVSRVRVQREPWAKGERVEAFATERFRKERLWHVEIEFIEPRQGMLVVGDGRFLGLGLMAPVAARGASVISFALEGLTAQADGRGVAQAARRAVLACVGANVARGGIPPSISGHRQSGEHTRNIGRVSFFVDVEERRLYLSIDGAVTADDRAVLEKGLSSLSSIAAGTAGLLRVHRLGGAGASRALGIGQRWRTLTPYRVERHAKSGDASAAVVDDVVNACHRARLPTPRVTVKRVEGQRGHGVLADVELEFAVAVSGPLLLGRDRFEGGGVFIVDCT